VNDTEKQAYWTEKREIAQRGVDYADRQLGEGLFSERELLEGQTPEQLIEHKQALLSEISDRERVVNLINDVLDGYGCNPELIG
jgi:hypothetical protein